MDLRIINFISRQTCLTLATENNNQPYCASCFYVYLRVSVPTEEEINMLIFKSKKETQHIRNVVKNKFVAGTIHPDKLEKTRVQGIQFTGKIFEPKDFILKKAKEKYYKRYPYALPISGELWVIELETVKMTDNKLGFGKRLEWKLEIRN